MKDFLLSVVTPERSIVSQEKVEAVVLPTSVGQLTLLPGHVNYLTSMRHGTFAYKVGEEWKIAFMAGGFAQVFDNQVTVLAETMDMAHELDLAAAEHEVTEAAARLKNAKLGSPEYITLSHEHELALAKVRAAQKKIH